MNASLFARLPPGELEKRYQQWKNDPTSVSTEWGAFFEGYELGGGTDSLSAIPVHQPNKRRVALPDPPAQPSVAKAESYPEDSYCLLPDAASEFRGKVTAMMRLFRLVGHQFADCNPLEVPMDLRDTLLSLDSLGFQPDDLDRSINIKSYKGGIATTLRDIYESYADAYCGGIGFEYMHIDSIPKRKWIEEKITEYAEGIDFGIKSRRKCLFWLTKATLFEEFLGKKFLGEKRFSLEGGEGLIILMQGLLRECSKLGVTNIELGMAHRGRLNVLANILKKSLQTILYEFTPGYLPNTPFGDSDVKYHLGYEGTRTINRNKIDLHLSANPSHLEVVYPVMEGRARARQKEIGDKDRKCVLPLALHGDAAFAGQGIVAEVLNMSQLRGYRTGGTIHIVINNQIGFTTSPSESRSSRYATDVAKMVESPILHVNGERAEDLLWAAQFALEYRQAFGTDIVIDMFCYRRLGHNETDQTAFTAPLLARKIDARKRFMDIYRAQLVERGDLDETVAQAMTDKVWRDMEKQYTALMETPKNQQSMTTFTGSTGISQGSLLHEPVPTGINLAVFHRVSQALTTLPDGFTMHPTLEKRYMARRIEAFATGNKFDWGMAEALAWGSLLTEGFSVRLSGQDCQRGTFSHRHAMLHDFNTGDVFVPINGVNQPDTYFRVYNSALSEAGVLAFEYGMSIGMPKTLVLWEAQFGDFSNGAQAIIDQFISSAESKWHQPSDVVLLLPHGYEGAGSEHSSARIERYLQLCAERNLQVLNLTTPAQYFHALRRQMHQDVKKPLILFTPKSLLSHEEAVSNLADFLESTAFQEIIPDPAPPSPQQVKRAVFCTGKVYYDLLRYRRENDITDTVIIRIEQIYPLHEELLMYILAGFPNVRDFCWCQEEPQNMGAWNHIRTRLGKNFATSFRYAGRPMMSSPAEGAKAMHYANQRKLVRQAFGTTGNKENA